MILHRFFIVSAFAWPLLVSLSPAQEGVGQRQVFQANDEWRAIQYEAATIAKGSVLDFSTELDAPAGKHGEAALGGGHLVFKDAPEKFLRLYGVVVSHTLPFQDRAGCERTADYLAACGYNWVRLHNYNFGSGVMKETGSTEFAPEALDQLEYFLFCLKQRGIYFTLPLNAWGFFKAGDVKDVAEFRDKAFRFEASGLLPISQDLQKWFREYSRNLLGHINPYTKVALKDDPALLSLELTNEDSLFAVMGQHAEFVEIYRTKCREQMKVKLGREPAKDEVEKALPDFVVDLQKTFFLTMKDFLRDLGVQKPLTDLNFRDNMVYTIPRQVLDYVDVHDYWSLYHNLPEKPVKGEIPYQQNFANPHASGWSSYLGPTAARIFGRPYASSEFNGCYPSPFWVHTGPFESALAGMQDWTMVARCGIAAHAKDFLKVITPSRINTSASPLMMLSERIGAMLLAQQEVRPLTRKLPFAVTPEYLMSHADLTGGPRYPRSYTNLAFQYQLGTILLDGTEDLAGYACVVVPPDMELPASLKNRSCLRADATLPEQLKTAFPSLPDASDTSFQLDPARGSVQIITPRTETFLLPASVREAAGSCIRLSGNQHVSVCFAASRDGKPLDVSRRVLLLHLTDLKASGLAIEPEAKKKDSFIVRERGKLPLLVQQNTLGIRYRRSNSRTPHVWALKYDGTRAVEIPVQPNAEGFAFSVQAMTRPDVFSAYELVWDE